MGFRKRIFRKENRNSEKAFIIFVIIQFTSFRNSIGFNMANDVLRFRNVFCTKNKEQGKMVFSHLILAPLKKTTGSKKSN